MQKDHIADYWGATYSNETCDDNGPESMYQVPSGPPGATSLGSFDDRAIAYRCYVVQ